MTFAQRRTEDNETYQLLRLNEPSITLQFLQRNSLRKQNSARNDKTYHCRLLSKLLILSFRACIGRHIVIARGVRYPHPALHSHLFLLAVSELMIQVIES